MMKEDKEKVCQKIGILQVNYASTYMDSFLDFKDFGGWTTPSIKTTAHKVVCGKEANLALVGSNYFTKVRSENSSFLE